MSDQPITRFEDEYHFLSNFHTSPVKYDGVVYPTVEHAFQAAKTLVPAERKRILNAPFPNTAKKLGRVASLRNGWDGMRVGVMEELLRQKFEDDPLRQALLDTGDAKLVESNWWGDVFWGVCEGTGSNMLGKLLMKIRKELRDEDA